MLSGCLVGSYFPREYKLGSGNPGIHGQNWTPASPALLQNISWEHFPGVCARQREELSFSALRGNMTSGTRQSCWIQRDSKKGWSVTGSIVFIFCCQRRQRGQPGIPRATPRAGFGFRLTHFLSVLLAKVCKGLAQCEQMELPCRA